jgi:hypothetical protein
MTLVDALASSIIDENQKISALVAAFAAWINR